MSMHEEREYQWKGPHTVIYRQKEPGIVEYLNDDLPGSDRSRPPGWLVSPVFTDLDQVDDYYKNTNRQRIR